MSLYQRLLEEVQREGIEYQPPQTGSGREPTGELRMLRRWTFHEPTTRWSAMAYAALKRRYPVDYERFLLQKNGGK